ncbi:MAG TPA: VCBS repeat-containing protein [Planctomycetota bacterium]|nr:VCBS repeat-containing protein [Planctomycetota bacterium]
MKRPVFRHVLPLVLALAAALGALQALGFVNPNFTPKNVEAASKLIFTVRVEALDADGKGATLTVVEAVKGQLAAKKLRLDFKSAAADGKLEDFIDLLKAAGTRPALIAAGEFEGKACALMHVEACWARLAKGADDATWSFDRMDASLNGTFNGGTDMLIETMKFIRKFPSAPIMPVAGGVRWSEHTKLGTLPGKAASLQAADVDADGKLDLFAACPEGDRIHLQKAGGKFDEKALEPGSKSLAAAWADFDGDGRPDLASLGKDGPGLWLQKEPGKFSATNLLQVGAKRAPVAAENASIGIVDLEPDGKPELVVCAGGTPVIFKNDGKGGFSDALLPAEAKPVDRGLAGPCVVADFDADGFADIVQVFQKGGLLWKGQAGGFAEPADCNALMGKPKSRNAYVADMDGDGLLDIFLIGGGSTPYMLQNRGGAKFEETMRLTGEPGYIIQPGASCAAPGDYNNDTFADVYVGYEEEPSQSFFNRGFRSFAIDETLKFKNDDLADSEKGQAAMAWADFDASGSLELVTALANGDLYLSRTDLGQMDKPLFLPVPVRPDVKSAAPVVVRFYLEGRCLGARTASRFGPPALLGVPEPGVYIVKYRAEGGKEVSFEMEPGAKPAAPPKGPDPKAATPVAPGTPSAPLSKPATAASFLRLSWVLGGTLSLAVLLVLLVLFRKKSPPAGQ